MNKYQVLDVPIRRQRQFPVKLVDRSRKVVKRPKKKRTSFHSKVRRDLVVPTNKKNAALFKQVARKHMELGVRTITMFDTIFISRVAWYRSLKGAVAASTRARKRAVDFSAKKSILSPVTSGIKKYVPPTGTRRQKWVIRQTELAETAEACKATIHNLPDGSYNRSAPTAQGGELSKTLGPGPSVTIMTEAEARLDETMRYAEATGQYNPQKEEE